MASGTIKKPQPTVEYFGTVKGIGAWSNNNQVLLQIDTTNGASFKIMVNDSGTITGQYVAPT